MELNILWNTSNVTKKQKETLSNLCKENNRLSKEVDRLNATINIDKVDIKNLNTKLVEANRRIEIQKGIISDMTDGKYFENKTEREVEYVDYCDI